MGTEGLHSKVCNFSPSKVSFIRRLHFVWFLILPFLLSHLDSHLNGLENDSHKHENTKESPQLKCHQRGQYLRTLRNRSIETDKELLAIIS